MKKKITKAVKKANFFLLICLLSICSVKVSVGQINENFNGAALPTGWAAVGTPLWNVQQCEGAGALGFNGNGDGAITPAIINPNKLNFDKKRSNNTTAWSMQIQISDASPASQTSGPWTTVATITTIAATCSAEPEIDLSAYTGLRYVRFLDNRASGAHERAIDNVVISVVTVSSTLSASATLAEPATISALGTAFTGAVAPQQNAVANFDFNFIDDGATPATDATDTQISQIVFNAGTGNGVTSWSDAIQEARLSDGTNTLLSTTITASAITFASIPNGAGQLGRIADNATKTYTLTIRFKNPMTGSAPATIDGQDFVFLVNNSSFTFAAGGLAASQSVNSGDGNNTVAVVASELRFVTQPGNTAKDDTMTPPTVEATDPNGNRDMGFTNTVSITSTGTLNTSPKTATALAGLATFSNIIHTATGTGFTLTATSIGLTSVTSSTFSILNTTTLFPGDVAMVAFNTNDFACSGDDSDFITFICFKDIVTGTAIDITDNGWQRVNANQWGDTEGAVRCTYTGATTITAGTKITFRLPNTGLPTATDWSFVDLGSGSSVNMNSGGDQLYFMQGGTWTNPAGAHNATYTGGRILFAFNTKNVWTAFANTTQDSGLYPNMRCFSTTIAGNYMRYTGTSTATTRRNWIDRINNVTNWTTYTNCTDYNSATSPTFTITAGSTIAGKWLGGTSTDWFDCKNWENLAVPESIDNVTIATTATSNPTISIASSFAADFSNIAQCNNINISKLALTLEGNANNRLDVYGNLTISGTGSIDMNDGNNTTTDGQIRLSGNFINQVAAGLDEGNGTFRFNGTSEQTIQNTAATSEGFFNIIVDKAAADLKLLDNITIGTSTLSSGITLTNGDINLNGFNIELGDTGSIIENLQDSGSRRIKDLTATYESSLPGGNSGGYIRATNRLVNTTNTNLAGLGLFLQRTAGADYNVELRRYHYRAGGGISIRRGYDVSVVSGTVAGTNTNLAINYAGEELASYPESLLTTYRWISATGWFQYMTGLSRNATTNLVSATTVNGFSYWTLSPESVQLQQSTRLSATPNHLQKTLTLSWQNTLANSTLERSTDGIIFKNGQNIEGKTTFIDKPNAGRNYYRLQWLDSEGKQQYSNVVYHWQEAEKTPISIYPNPFTSYIYVQNQQATEILHITLLDMQGQTLFSEDVQGAEAETAINKVLQNLQQGTYILVIWQGTEKIMQKIIKQ